MRHALMCFFAAATLSAASLNFQSARSYFAGAPTFVFAGDFNGDGKTDLVDTSWGAPVQVLLSNGDGTFRPVQGSTSTEFLPEGAAIADFNGDGKLDLAVASDGGGITILFGQGNGKFYNSTVNVALEGSAMAAGDVNGDGFPDLVVEPTPGSGGQYVLLLGKGNGTFQNPKVIGNSLISPGPPILMDVNGDGKIDLVYSYTGEVVTQLGNGDGTFGSPLLFAISGTPQALAVVDMNGDGTPDLVIAGFEDLADSIVVALGKGDGTFSIASATPVANLPSFLAVGDFNEDGHMDVVASSQPENSPAVLTVLLGDGKGSLSSQASFVSDRAGPMAIGDFNGDQHLDLATANGSGGTIDITLGDGHGNFPGPLNPSAGPAPWSGIAAGDLNGDGKADLAVVNSFVNVHEVDILIGNGDGTFQAPAAIQVGVSPSSVAMGDVNHDGVPDLVVADTGSPAGVYVLLGQGGGKFAAPVYYASPAATTVILRDVNGDGVPDIVGLTRNPANVMVLVAKGDGTFFPVHTYAAGVLPVTLATGDFNRDGHVDIAVSDGRGGAVLLLPGAGNGTFGPPVTVASMQGPIGIVAADLNGDGKLDIAVSSEGLGSVLLLAGNGDGTFQPPVSFKVTGGGARGLVAADFDGDGHLDLLTTAHYGFQFAVLLGDGAGNFQNAASFDSGGSPSLVVPVDINGDGLPDLAISNGVFTGEPSYLTVILNTSH